MRKQQRDLCNTEPSGENTNGRPEENSGRESEAGTDPGGKTQGKEGSTGENKRPGTEKEVRKEEPMVKDIPDLDRDRREEEALKELQEPVEGNNLIVKNDSDIDDTVDYMGVVEGFFN